MDISTVKHTGTYNEVPRTDKFSSLKAYFRYIRLMFNIRFEFLRGRKNHFTILVSVNS